MSAVEPQDTTRESEEILKRIGDGSGSEFDIFAGALALAALERPRIELARYRVTCQKLLTMYTRTRREVSIRSKNPSPLCARQLSSTTTIRATSKHMMIFRMPT